MLKHVQSTQIKKYDYEVQCSVIVVQHRGGRFLAFEIALKNYIENCTILNS